MVLAVNDKNKINALPLLNRGLVSHLPLVNKALRVELLRKSVTQKGSVILLKLFVQSIKNGMYSRWRKYLASVFYSGRTRR